MKRRLVSMLLVLSLIFAVFPVQAFAASTVKPVSMTNPFKDVEQGSWYYDAVQYVRMNGLFNGTSKTTFRPDGTMTRGMFVTVLGRMAGVDPDSYSGPSGFIDVPENAYYAPYVAWASKYGITKGTGNKKFSPNAYVDRQQMAVFFVRYFELFDVDYETGANITTTPKDIDSVSPWARDAVLKLWRTALIKGYGKNFNPAGTATRAQVATICYRADKAVDTWYSEPGVPSTRVRINPATGLPYDDGSQPSGVYTVTFYDGSRIIDTLHANEGEPLGSVPSVAKSSKAGAILEGYYTDSGFTTPFYAEAPVTGNMSVYAKYESMGDAETLTIDSFAKMDMGSDVYFTIKGPAGSTPDNSVVTLVVKDGSDPVTIRVEDNGDGTYKVYAPAGFNEGCSYELELADGWTFVNPDYPDADGIRTAAFSIEMDEVENLNMNDGIRYIKDTDQIDYTYTDKDEQSQMVAELPSDADITKGGSFNYTGNTNGWEADDILCIYVGDKPDSKEEGATTKEAIYAKVRSIDGGTVNFVPLEDEDQMRLYDIPDNFPIKVDELPTEETGTVTLSELDTATYALMVDANEDSDVNAAKAKLGVGDFVSIYVDPENIKNETDVYIGEITDVTDGTITFTKCTAEDIEESSNLYKEVDIENTDIITPAEQAYIERVVQAQVEQSSFGEEAAYMLADMATKTDTFRSSAGILRYAATGADGEPMSSEELASYAGVMVLADDDGDGEGDNPKVKVQVILDPDKLHFGSKGVQLAVNVSAEFEVDGKDDGKIKFELSATFVQEAAVDPKVKGELVYKKILGFIPVPTGVQVNAIVDVKSYTAMSLRADIYTVAPEEESTWEKLKSFLKDPSDLGELPGVPDELKQGLKSVGDVLNKIEDIKSEIDKALDNAEELKDDLDTLWDALEDLGIKGLDRDSYEETLEALDKTNVAKDLMDMLTLAGSDDEDDEDDDGDISAEYIEGLDGLMEEYSKMLERETDWVQLVKQQMFDTHTPPQYGIIVGVKGDFVVSADVNIALGTNLEYEVGKRFNFWFRVGLFKPTSGSSTMDLIDERFAFQFYVMGKIGVKTGVQLTLYAAIGSIDAVSVGLNAELGPYVKLWGFFIYDYSKYRPANTTSWTSKQQMAGAMYLEFGLYLTVGVQAKALFLEWDKDFVDEEFPLLDAGDKLYCYGTAYEPLDESDEIVVYNNGTADLQPDCAVSMQLPEEAYAMKYMDLTTGKQSTRSLGYDNYTFKVSNPNFRVDNVNGKPVVSVVTIPQDVRLMQCDLTITYKYGKLAFSTFDMSTTVHLAWTNMTANEYQQVYTASVIIPDGNGGMETIWSKRVRKGTQFNLPTEDEIKQLLSWSDAKYTVGTGYGSQPVKDVTLIQNQQYTYDLGYKSYTLTVTGIQGQDGSESSREFTAKYGEPFDFSPLLDTGENGPDVYTRFVGLTTADGQTLALNQPANGRVTRATAVYEDETVTATFTFTGLDVQDGEAQEDIKVKLRKGGAPDTTAAEEVVPGYLALTYYPEIGPMYSDTVFQAVCEAAYGYADITFATGGSEVEVADISKPVGGVLGTLPAPERTGYTFGGWFTDDGTFQEQVDENTVVPEGGMTLYAKWTANNITVTFNINGGMALPEGDSTKAVKFGAPYGTLPVPEERTGYHFLGWFTALEGSTEVTAATTVATATNHTLYAHWRQLKAIPDTVFTFTPTTLTYNGLPREASYTFAAEAGETYTEDSFKVEYVRQSDKYITANTSYDGPQVTAGTYNIRITREEDEYYRKFDKTYTDVLTVNRLQVDFSEVTADNIQFPASEYGLTTLGFTKNKLPATVVGDLYFKVSNGSGRYQRIYKADMSSSPYLGYISGLNGAYQINHVGFIDDVNHVESWSQDLAITMPLKSAPATSAGGWLDKDGDNYKYADTSWYDENSTEFEIGTSEQFAGFSALVSEGELFAGKTVKLTADIDMSMRKWQAIYYQITKEIGRGFCGTFDGGGHTITGIYSNQFRPTNSNSNSDKYISGLFGVLGEGEWKVVGSTGSWDITPLQVTIKNLKLKDSYIQYTQGNGADYSGFASYCFTNAGEESYTKFEDCVFEALSSVDSIVNPASRVENWVAVPQGKLADVSDDCKLMEETWTDGWE